VISLDGDGVFSPPSVAVATTHERRTSVVVNTRVSVLLDGLIMFLDADAEPDADVDAIPSPHPHPTRNVEPAHARTAVIVIAIAILNDVVDEECRETNTSSVCDATKKLVQETKDVIRNGEITRERGGPDRAIAHPTRRSRGGERGAGSFDEISRPSGRTN
jgi:hypothetical protein